MTDSISRLTGPQRKRFLYLKTNAKPSPYVDLARIITLCERAGFRTTEDDAAVVWQALRDYWALRAEQSEANANMAAASILAENPPPTPAEDPAGLKEAAERLGLGLGQPIKHDAGKAPLGMLPAAALEAIAHVFKFGADKYSRDNWRAVVTDDPSRYIDAALRHIYAHADGEHDDPESGLAHLAHAGACVTFLLWAMGEGMDTH